MTTNDVIKNLDGFGERETIIRKKETNMPYIRIKGKPKTAEIKERLVERINQALLEVWGCRQEAISISIEEIDGDQWEESVVKAEIEPNADKMYILHGVKKF
jgi:4-oxalocrotonate tautomerase family enzyme